MKDLPIIPGRGFSTATAKELRLNYLQSQQIETDAISDTQLDIKNIQNNIESFIGSVEIPLGIVGPLIFNNPEPELVYTAVGTLEGALVYSMNRGARVISKCGGVSASVKHQKMLRAPMFIFENQENAQIFQDFSQLHFDFIKQTAESYSNHAKLIEIEGIIIDNSLTLRFYYSTGDASGQNMTTTCTWHAVLQLIEKFNTAHPHIAVDYVIEGNGASDKKVSQNNIQQGRGVHVTAECFLTDSVIQDVLRTTAKKIHQFIGPSKKLAEKDGMLGYNINVANSIASIFVATGQDLACIHESGTGFLDVQYIEEHSFPENWPHSEGGLHLTLTLPNLVIGTLGGGTHLPKQAQCLEMMGCKGQGKVNRFAQLITSFALGLEISTYAAIVSGEFAKAHEKLGRNKPVNWLLKSEIHTDFLNKVLNEPFKQKIGGIAQTSWTELPGFDNGILTHLTQKITQKITGYHPILITGTPTLSGHISQNTIARKETILLKSKPLSDEVIKGLHFISAGIDPQLADLLFEYKSGLEYQNCHLKELDVNNILNQLQFKHSPSVYGTFKDPLRETYLLFTEYLSPKQMLLHNSENQPEKWDEQHIKECILAIQKVHEKTQCKSTPQSETQQLKSCNPIIPDSVQEFQPWNQIPLYVKMLEIMQKNHGLSADVQQRWTGFEEEWDLLMRWKHELQQAGAKENWEIEHQQVGYSKSESSKIHKCLIHNDFNPRNIMIQMDGFPYFYDWELAVIDYPHRDVAELLSFTMPSNFRLSQLLDMLEFHHDLNPGKSWESWKNTYTLSLKNLILCRLSFYEVSSIVSRYEFSTRVLQNALKMYNLLQK